MQEISDINLWMIHACANLDQDIFLYQINNYKLL